MRCLPLGCDRHKSSDSVQYSGNEEEGDYTDGGHERNCGEVIMSGNLIRVNLVISVKVLVAAYANSKQASTSNGPGDKGKLQGTSSGVDSERRKATWDGTLSFSRTYLSPPIQHSVHRTG